MRRRNTYGDDDALARGLRRREPDAMETLYERLSRRAYGLAYRILGDEAAAEDAVQDAFFTVWRQAERLSPQRGRLSSFVLTVVHHKAIDLLRTTKGRLARQMPLDPVTLEAEAEVMESAARSIDRGLLNEAVQCLPEEQQQCLQMAYFEGMTHVEIAEELRLPLGTVKSRLRLAMEKLRFTLRPLDEP